MPQTKLSPEIITAAIRGFEAQKEQIDHQIAELRSMLEDGQRETVGAAPSETGQRKRRKFSAASRRKMALAQKARWAAIKQPSEPQPVTSEAPKPKRKLSAAGRKRIIEATKKRWAAVKAAKEAEKPAVAKRAGGKKAAA
jgi:hypothetical protein